MTSLLSERFALLGSIDAIDHATSAVSSDWCDLTKFGRLMVLLGLGAITGTFDMKLQEATDSSGTGAQDITGKAITQFAATDDNKQAIINIHSSELSTGFTHVKAIVTPVGGTTNFASCHIFGGDATYGPASDNDLASVDEIIA